MAHYASFITALMFLGLLCRYKTDGKCENNVQRYPEYQNLIPENIEPSGTSNTRFPREEDYYNNSIIVNMFRENGINRRCTTLKELQEEDCARTLDCHIYACFGYIPEDHGKGKKDENSEEVKLDPSTQFTVELYGYVEVTSPAWVAVAFMDENGTLSNSLAFLCVRVDHHDFKLFVVVANEVGAHGVKLIKEQTFAKLAYAIGDLNTSFMLNHIYCRINVDQVISIKNDEIELEFSSSSFYTPLLAVGNKIESIGVPNFQEDCFTSRPKQPMRIYRPGEPVVYYGQFTAFLHCLLVIIVLYIILFLIKVSNRRRFLKLRKIIKIIKEAKANN